MNSVNIDQIEKAQDQMKIQITDIQTNMKSQIAELENSVNATKTTLFQNKKQLDVRLGIQDTLNDRMKQIIELKQQVKSLKEYVDEQMDDKLDLLEQ